MEVPKILFGEKHKYPNERNCRQYENPNKFVKRKSIFTLQYFIQN